MLSRVGVVCPSRPRVAVSLRRDGRYLDVEKNY
jgi:hypothetical protein